MGAGCFKGSDSQVDQAEQAGGTLRVMFNRFDKDKKGYISMDDLKHMMKDDKTHFKGKDASHIMEKYGTDGKMTFSNFELWWTSTYTTYNEDALSRIVEEVNEETSTNPHMEAIPEIPELPEVPHNSNVAISRS